MLLVYPIKIKFEDKRIISLISPHLRMEFITKYHDLIKRPSSTSLVLTMDTLDIDILQKSIKDYVNWLKKNNYVLRMPEHLRIDLLQPGEQWVNIQIDVPIKKGPVEYISNAFGILLFLTTAALGEFSFIMAARFNKVSYTKIILPILTDFTMAAVIYVYSGTAANIDIKGKELDDWWHNRIGAPTEIEVEKENHSLLSSWSISRFMLHTLPLLYTIFKYIGYWQSMMSMRDEVKELNLNDQIISPKFVYNFAIAGTSIGAAYTMAQCTSLSLQATNILKGFLDKCYDLYIEKVNCVKKQNYVEISRYEEPENAEEFGAIDDNLHTKAILLSPFDIEQTENNEQKTTEEHVVFFLNKVIYNNLLLNKKDFLHKIFQIGGMRSVQEIIGLGEDYDVANAIIEAIEKYGIDHVVKILFEDLIKEPTLQDFVKEIPQLETTTDQWFIEQNFFLNNKKGRIFIQKIANYFDKDILDIILELGTEQDIAEQIISEAEVQGIGKVIDILLGKKETVSATDNIENIIGHQELNQLTLISDGIFNTRSNKAYKKIVKYVDNLAKILDDMLNVGKQGDQVTITLLLLENILEFAVSGQRFMGIGRQPYYDPGDDHDYPYGGAGDNDHDSYAEVHEHQGEFIGLSFLSSNNNSDYNLHNISY